MSDEPRFLKDPPPGPAVVKPATAPGPRPASGSPPARPMTAAELIASMAADPALRAAGIQLESDELLAARRRQAAAAFATAPSWERGAGWQGAWVEQRLGGLRVSAPGGWRFDEGAEQHVTWTIPSGALMHIGMLGFEKRAPSVRDYLTWRDRTSRHGYERIGVREIGHPHADAPAGTALELAEHDPRPLEWPVRWLRFASWSGTAILCLQLDTDGLIEPGLGADLARMWRELR